MRAVIFDTDGVIIRTAEIHSAAWKSMFDEFLSVRDGSGGEILTPFTADDYRRYVDGRARADGVARFLESRGIAIERGSPSDDPGCDTVWGLGNRKNRLFLARVGEGGVDAYPSTVALVRRLRSRGIATAAVSASENAGAMLEAAGVGDLFDARVDGTDARDLGLAGKPDPALFLEAARRLGSPPADSVVVEDAEAGVEAGRRGGFGLVLGVDRRRSPQGLLRHGADLVVPDLSSFDVDEDGRWRVAAENAAVTDDPAWMIHLGDGARARRNDALLCLADGRFGTRGEGSAARANASPMVLASGVYRDRDQTELLEGPLWNQLEVEGADPARERRVLNLRSGVLTCVQPCAGGEVTSTWLNSISHPGVMAMRAEGSPGAIHLSAPLESPPPAEGVRFDGGVDDDRAWSVVTGSSGAGMGAVASQRRTPAVDGAAETVDRLAVYVADGSGPAPLEAAFDGLRRAEGAGFEQLLREQQAAWRARWSDAEVSIEGDPEVELAVRFAIFHLLSSVADVGEAVVGARGLSGLSYGGHVFWDSDVFVLPALVAIHPQSARAMLEYRLRRLPAARRLAESQGRAGARFPWESGLDGNDVTPRLTRDRDGRVIPIRTGQHEEHIVADVAWAASHYSRWSGDEDFLTGPGRALIVEAAQYWASRARYDPRGAAHLYGVIGPDEYHEIVDDNAFTNVMARWNLRAAAHLMDPGGTDRSGAADQWRMLADALVDGVDPVSGRYEQFNGFDDLEPLLISEVAAPPVAADLLLGPDRIKGSQVIKQADVLMLHHLVPDEVAAGSLGANLDFYLPRTAHGSSLSPAIHASLLARAGRADEALGLLRMACRLDLDDLTGMTGGGLHLATMGGVWQAIVFGFAGARARDRVLELDPRLPANWERLSVKLRFQGRRLQLRLSDREIEIDTDGLIQVGLPGRAPDEVAPPGRRFVRGSGGWEGRTA